MSFPFGNRSSFRDKTMRQSKDEILDDMLKNIKQRKKEFFESPPRWRSTGMFDDELGSAGGSRFKDHLGDLAARHPELADHLFDFLPEDRKSGTIPKDQKKSEDHRDTAYSVPRAEVIKPSKSTTGTQTSSYDTEIGTQTTGLESDIKLRNTVPDMQASAGESVTDGDRGQRSQSAPPQTSSVPNKQQKEEGVRLIPIRTGPTPQPEFQIPRPEQMPPHYQSHPQHFPEQGKQQEETRGPTVRHIPIFVEGRDEPIIPKDATLAGSSMKRGGCQGKTESNSKKGPPPEEKRQQGQAPEQQQPQQPPPPTPPQRPDPLAVVAEIVKEVEALSAKVNEWNGNSRTAKEYIYLDEMLTRNLLKLDNVETEGREEVRTARKDAIKRIQAAISVLESKSITENVANNSQVNIEEGTNVEEMSSQCSLKEGEVSVVGANENSAENTTQT